MLEQVRQFIDRFDVADETSTVTEQLVQLLSYYSIGGRQIHDANIVATMMAYDIANLLTHNTQDFERFGECVAIETIR